MESGLNDGIATPFVNLFLAGAPAPRWPAPAGGWPARSGQLAGGAGLGVGVGGGGGLLLRRPAAGAGPPASRPLAVLGLALVTYGTALLAGTNGFVAAFVAGMAFGAVMPADDGGTVGFTEERATLLALLVWFAFGAAMVVPGIEAAAWSDIVFAVLALTVVRMAPVALALVGSGPGPDHGGLRRLVRAPGPGVGGLRPHRRTTARPGRRRAGAGRRDRDRVLSVVAHGVTAAPLAARYATSPAPAAGRPEHAASPAIPTGRSAPGGPGGGPPTARTDGRAGASESEPPEGPTEGQRHGAPDDRAEDGAGQDVARVVHAGVDPRVPDRGGQGTSGRARTGMPSAAPKAKAKAEAVCPEGNEVEVGIRTEERSGLSVRSGRPRRKAALTPRLATAEVTPTASRPRTAARRPGQPPTTASPAATPSQRRE